MESPVLHGSRSVLALLLAIGLAATGCVIEYRSSFTSQSALSQSGSVISPELELKVEKTDPDVAGQWTAKLGRAKSVNLEHFWFSFTVKDTVGNVRGVSQRMSDFPALIEGENYMWPGSVVCTNQAGALQFTGERSGKEIRGGFQFVPDPTYGTQVSAALKTNVTSLDCFWLGLHQLSVTDVVEYSKVGIPLSVPEVCRLKNHGVKPEFMSELRQVKAYSIDDLIRLRNHGVRAELPVGLQKAGYPVDVDSLIRLRNHGVRVEDAQGWREAGYNLSVDQLIHLRQHGVRPDFGKAIRTVLPNASPDDLVSMRQRGVTEDFVQGMRKADPKFTVDEMVYLRSHGVTSEYVAEWRKAGFGFNADELTRLRQHGVPASLAAAFNVPDRKPLPVDTLIMLRQRGVTDDFAKAMWKADPKVSVDEMVQLRANSVTPEYVAEWRKAGFDFTAGELIKLRQHSVPANYAAALNVPNRKPLSVDTLIMLRQRGLSAEQVRELRE